MPQAIVIQCVPSEPLYSVAPNGAQLQAALLNLLRSVNPQLATELHDGNVLRSYAVSWLQARERHCHESKLRVACLDDRICQALVQWANASLEQGLKIQIGQTQYTVVRVLASNASGESWVGKATFDELAARAWKQETMISLKFATPTVFGQGNREEAVPLPRHVFGSLLRRWNVACPDKLQIAIDDIGKFLSHIEENIVLAHPFELRSVIADLGDQLKLTGFVGDVTYRIRGKSDCNFVQFVNLLADAAFFTGVGKKTSRGCGAVRRQIAKD